MSCVFMCLYVLCLYGCVVFIQVTRSAASRTISSVAKKQQINNQYSTKPSLSTSSNPSSLSPLKPLSNNTHLSSSTSSPIPHSSSTHSPTKLSQNTQDISHNHHTEPEPPILPPEVSTLTRSGSLKGTLLSSLEEQSSQPKRQGGVDLSGVFVLDGEKSGDFVPLLVIYGVQNSSFNPSSYTHTRTVYIYIFTWFDSALITLVTFGFTFRFLG